MAMAGGSYTISQPSDVKTEFDKVDFLCNKIIEGEEHEMGVFKLVTSRYDFPGNYNPETDYGAYMLNNINDSIIQNEIM